MKKLSTKMTTDNYVIFITDGRPYPASEDKMFKKYIGKLKKMKDLNGQVSVYAIGVGLKKNQEVLDEIASNPDNKFPINSMTSLGDVVSSMREKVCTEFASTVGCDDQRWTDTCTQACARQTDLRLRDKFMIACRDLVTDKQIKQECTCPTARRKLRGAIRS